MNILLGIAPYIPIIVANQHHSHRPVTEEESKYMTAVYIFGMMIGVISVLISSVMWFRGDRRDSWSEYVMMGAPILLGIINMLFTVALALSLLFFGGYAVYKMM